MLASPDLVNPDLVNLMPVSPAERYSYSFDGNAQTLDHVLVNSALQAATSSRRSEHARIGADFPEIARNNPIAGAAVGSRPGGGLFHRGLVPGGLLELNVE